MANHALMTPRQRQIYDYITERISSCGYPPTIREIGAHLGIRSTNGVADHLKALKRKGYLAQAASKSRTWCPLPGHTGEAEAGSAQAGQAPEAQQARPLASTRKSAKGAPALPQERRRPRDPGAQLTVSVPLLGRVAGGAPMLAEEQADGTLQVDPQLLPRGANVFALRVVGQSMVEAGIGDGDLVFVQKVEQAQAGSIVVVRIDDEATVKTYLPRADRIILRPANKDFKDIVLHAEAMRQVEIIGVVVGVYRRL
jgi:repressor LexA